MTKKGIFITLEGNEGCGKSTQTQLLYLHLLRQGKKVFVTREPGGTGIGDQIRQVLLDNKNKKMSPLTESLLYMASRAQLVEEEILPRLSRGEIVICDRWLDATIAYQGYAGGMDKKWLASMGKIVTQKLAPDVTLFLDLPLKVGLERAVAHKEADRMERKQIHYHELVRKGYQAIARKEPKRFRRIKLSPEDSIEAVHEKIKDELSRVLAKN